MGHGMQEMTVHSGKSLAKTDLGDGFHSVIQFFW
jgi:hypothetical protein